MFTDMEEEMEREMQLEFHEMFGDAPRPKILTQTQIDKIHSQGKETPDDYQARHRRESTVKAQKRETVAEQKTEREANAELPPVKVAPREFRIQVQQARQAAGMKQVDLAQKAGVKVTLIQDFEAGKPGGVLPKPVEGKIKRILKL